MATTTDQARRLLSLAGVPDLFQIVSTRTEHADAAV